jgi:hypothetical protein
VSGLAFITGASSGIGQALALRYAQAGWRLALVARRADLMQAWADSHQLTAERCAIYAADVGDDAAITAAARACIASQGLPDLVIANAGISLGVDTAYFEDLAVMRQVYATNVFGMAATFQPFILPMRERGSGTLVGVSSVAGVRGLPGHAAYCSSKAATTSYCETLRGECRGSGVKVVTIAPGYVATPLTSKNRYAMPFLLQPAEFAERAFKAIASGARYRVIPWPMGLVAALLRILPNALFDRIFANQPRKHRHTE